MIEKYYRNLFKVSLRSDNFKIIKIWVDIQINKKQNDELNAGIYSKKHKNFIQF